MSKTLYVPDHVAEKEKERKKSVYVKKDEKVLDPSLLDVSLSERLPPAHRMAFVGHALHGTCHNGRGRFDP